MLPRKIWNLQPMRLFLVAFETTYKDCFFKPVRGDISPVFNTKGWVREGNVLPPTWSHGAKDNLWVKYEQNIRFRQLFNEGIAFYMYIVTVHVLCI